jgi:hypothetical protein
MADSTTIARQCGVAKAMARQRQRKAANAARKRSRGEREGSVPEDSIRLPLTQDSVQLPSLFSYPRAW